MERNLNQVIESARQSVVAIAPLIPRLEEFQREVEEIVAQSKRGYLLPNEDDVVRQAFRDYLTCRSVLRETLRELKPHVMSWLKQGSESNDELFAVSYCTACLLVNAGQNLIETFRKERVIWKKLDEPEPNFGIPRKQFTRIYRSLSSPINAWTFSVGVNYWNEHRDRLLELSSSERFRPIIEILLEEEKRIQRGSKLLIKRRLSYRWHSFLRRHNAGYRNVMFSLFKVSGSLIAELRMKWKRKRVTPGVVRKFERLLLPGDVIVTRHDDAASNLFLPGFWPHAAFHIGTYEQRRELGVEMEPERWQRSESPVRVLEARKDGVLFRPLNDTLSVDAVALIRPTLTEPEIREGISRAITHEGKSYDFEFDFRRTHKLVCTEVVYRAFHGIGDIEFNLTPRAGRYSLSAEDLLEHAVSGNGFEVIAVYGCGNNLFREGENAKEALKKSLAKDH